MRENLTDNSSLFIGHPNVVGVIFAMYNGIIHHRAMALSSFNCGSLNGKATTLFFRGVESGVVA